LAHLSHEKFSVLKSANRDGKKRKIGDYKIFNFFCKRQTLFFVLVRTGPKKHTRNVKTAAKGSRIENNAWSHNHVIDFKR